MHEAMVLYHEAERVLQEDDSRTERLAEVLGIKAIEPKKLPPYTVVQVSRQTHQRLLALKRRGVGKTFNQAIMGLLDFWEAVL